MRAVVMNDYDTGARVGEIPDPKPGAGEILVEIRAATINGFDLFVASGAAKGMMEHHFPVVLSRDFAGVVAATGPAATLFNAGDEVFGLIANMELGVGTLAEYVAVPEGVAVAAKPPGITFEQAAALGVAGTTAQAAVEAVSPSAGERVLVAGASGGVGSFAVQLAAVRDAYVIATALPEDEDRLRALGAAEVVDYRGDCAETVRARYPSGVPVLIDLVNRGSDFDAMIDLLPSGGRVATALGAADVDALAARGISAFNVNAQAEPDALDRLAALAASKKITVPIQKVFPLAETLAAFEAFRGGKRGKLVISVG